jgi:hypothetical protein
MKYLTRFYVQGKVYLWPFASWAILLINVAQNWNHPKLFFEKLKKSTGLPFEDLNIGHSLTDGQT